MNNKTINELIAWLALTQIPEIGIVHIKKLLAHFHSVENICEAKKSDLQKLKLHAAQIDVIKNPNKTWIEIALKWCEQKNHHIIPITDLRYPQLLSEISSAPILLYVQGNWENLSQPQIAIVGSRNPSHTGLELSAEFAYLLSQAGFIVTSGLAIGVDGASHQGALNASGKTIAVLGSGLQKIYPKRNYRLAEKISENGCVISEFPLDAEPAADNFPRRNRIISGLSLGTLVIEAALRSGSLITANFALEQGRDVFAIPGSIRNPTSAGCLALIQNGAKCVTHVNDILEEMQTQPNLFSNKSASSNQSDRNEYQSKLDCIEQQVLACIDDNMTTIDQICERSKLSAQLVTGTLLQLELKSIVNRQLGGFIKTQK